jgi:hypothetical protein
MHGKPGCDPIILAIRGVGAASNLLLGSAAAKVSASVEYPS